MFRKDFCLLSDVAIFIEEELNLDLEEKLKIPGECFFLGYVIFFLSSLYYYFKNKNPKPQYN